MNESSQFATKRAANAYAHARSRELDHTIGRVSPDVASSGRYATAACTHCGYLLYVEQLGKGGPYAVHGFAVERPCPGAAPA